VREGVAAMIERRGLGGVAGPLRGRDPELSAILGLLEAAWLVSESRLEARSVAADLGVVIGDACAASAPARVAGVFELGRLRRERVERCVDVREENLRPVIPVSGRQRYAAGPPPSRPGTTTSSSCPCCSSSCPSYPSWPRPSPRFPTCKVNEMLTGRVNVSLTGGGCRLR
jgi:hypothetical protein